MNRQQRRQQKHRMQQEIQEWPVKFTELPPEGYPPGISPRPIRVWINREFMAQLYETDNVFHPGMLRLSVNRSRTMLQGGWADKITWDELDAIKRELGFGEWYGVEIYPRDQDVVKVANFRHLWLLPSPLAIGWFK